MSDTTDRMQDAARALAVILPPGTGFIIMAFDFGQVPGTSRLEYVSNGKREDVVNCMKEFIAITEAEGNWGKHLPS